MSNIYRTRKACALVENGTTFSENAKRLGRAAAAVMLFSALAACGVHTDAPSASDMAAFQPMSVPAWNTKADCDAAAAATKSANGGDQELTFSCDTVETAKLDKAADWSSANTGEPTSTANTLAAAPNGAASAPARTHTGGGVNPMMWYMLGNMMGNRTSVASSGFAPSTGGPAPHAYINSSGNGKTTMSAVPQFSTPTPHQYAGLKANGGVVKSSIIGSNLARASSYNASTSSVGAKSTAHSSVGHSSGGHGGGGGGGG